MLEKNAWEYYGYKLTYFSSGRLGTAYDSYLNSV